MKTIFISLIILVNVSCGKVLRDVFNIGDNTPITTYTTDPEFYSYIDNFNSDFSLNTKVAISFGDIDPYSETAVGACFKRKAGNYIFIRKETWESYNDYQKEVLIYHELGHCELNLGHVEGQFNLGVIPCPNSIMRSHMFSFFEAINCYARDTNFYIQEMK